MLTIVWDVDDVLNDLMAMWFHSVWLPAHPACGLRYTNLSENPPHRLLGIPENEYLASLDSFRLSSDATCLTPTREILDWLGRDGSRFRHIALTARPVQTAPQVAEWLFRHFGSYVRLFGVVPSRLEPSEPVYDKNKSEFLEWLGRADLFVDDSPANVAAAGELGIHSILYPQPWNGSTLTVAETLNEIAELERDRSAVR